MSELPVFLPATRTQKQAPVQTRLHKVTEKTSKCPDQPKMAPVFAAVLHNWRLSVENAPVPACPIPTPHRAKPTSTRAITTRHRAAPPTHALPVFPILQTFIPEISPKKRPRTPALPTFSKFSFLRQNILIDILRYLTAPGRCALPGAVMLS